jgi:hypothetical protein
VRELYDAEEHNRYGLKLLDRRAKDQPELAALWFEGARDGLLAALSEYLKRETARGTIKKIPTLQSPRGSLSKRWSLGGGHRYWDPHPQTVDDVAARETAVQLIVNALVRE